MKNRKFTYYILLPAVLIIWGLIIYKIVSKNTPPKQPTILSSPKTEEKLLLGKSYQLLMDYPDPFFYKKNKISKHSGGKTKKEKGKKQEQQKWANIRYNGFVLNKKDEKAHITAEGKNIILSPRDTFLEEYTLLKITKDSILIRKKKQTRWIKTHT